ncbi:hypothetical protein D3C71_1397750 [compost metagenome]
MHQAEARAQQCIGLAAALRCLQRGAQAGHVQAFGREVIAAVGRAEFGFRQRQVMRQRRVGHGLLVGKKNAHGQARVAPHEALREVTLHRQVVDIELGVKVPAARRAARGAAGHEHALALRRRLAAQLHGLERIDGHGRNVAPGLDIAQRGAAPLAETAKRRIGFVLVSEQAQGECVELFVGAGIHGDECEQICDQRGGLVHGIPSRA